MCFVDGLSFRGWGLHSLFAVLDVYYMLWYVAYMFIERKKRYRGHRLLGLEPVSLVIKRSDLRWIAHVKWIKQCDGGLMDIVGPVFNGCLW